MSFAPPGLRALRRLRGNHQRLRVWVCLLFVIVGAACVSATHLLRPRVFDARPVPAFETPPNDDGESISWIAIGDTGEGSPRQKRVAQGLARAIDRFGADFVTLLGDNFYRNGVASADDRQWQTAFTDVYSLPELELPFYAILGNHDHHGSPEAQVRWEGDERWVMPAPYYAFRMLLGNGDTVRFFMLDTNPIHLGAQSAAGQLRWLDDELGKTDARWTIVSGHHTIHSGGKHGDNPQLHARLEPILLRHGVDLYLNGHDHNLALMEPRCGLPMVVSGAGCKTRSVTWTDETTWASADLGFARVRLDAESLWVGFHDENGELVFAWQKREAGDSHGG